MYVYSNVEKINTTQKAIFKKTAIDEALFTSARA